MLGSGKRRRPVLLVLASTYPRWENDPEPGFIHELSKRLVSHFDVIVLCPHAQAAMRTERLDGVEVIRYRYAPERWETLVNDGGIAANLKKAKWKVLLIPIFVLAQLWAAWWLLRGRRIDVIHAHWLIPQGLVAVLLQWLSGTRVPFVVTSHGADLYSWRGLLLNAIKRIVIRRAASVTVVSTAMLDEIQRIGAPVGKVSVLSMGVDVSERFTSDDSVQRSQDEILFVGRLVEKKGVPYLIRALPAILCERPSVSLTVAGFGPERERLEALANKLGVAASIHFLGALSQSELPALYRRAALFVAPFVRTASGDQEGLPVALIEAIACGCPILVGNVAGLSDLLGEYADAVTLDPRDELWLAQRVVEALNDSLETTDRARNLSAYVGEKFEWRRVASAYEALLVSAIEK